MPYKLAIFDLDGTILSTLDDLTDSTNHALAVNGLPIRTTNEIRSFVGNGARLLIERAVPKGCPMDVTDKVFDEFRSYYAAHSDIKTCPYDGILDMLHELRKNGCRTAVLSNKPDFAVQTLCKQYFDGLLDFAAGEKNGIPRKPAPDSVNAILSELSVDRQDTVYIGDSDVDIDTAKNAGMDCISVDWGFRDRDFLLAHGAKNIASTAKELEAKILGA
ncbi:MAG: HAD family hydrolase [Clostridia bacterium]|nr:HAD family hydrolase [Clostridia bacterium]